MDYYVYIIKNRSTGILYKGQTNNLERRLREHELDRWKGAELLYVQICDSRSEAVNLERFFKSGKGREIILEFLKGSIV